MTDNEINALLEEIVNYVESCYRWEEPDWSLRKLHKEALRKFIERILSNKECKAIVQMPTGAGKSVLLATIAVACTKLREKGLLRDRDRDVIMVLAPLERIKFQLHKEILRSGGVFQKIRKLHQRLSGQSQANKYLDAAYHVAFINSKEFILNGMQKRSLKNEKISLKIIKVLEIKDTKCKVILLNDRAISYLRRTQLYQELIRRLLALFIDELHFLFAPKQTLGVELKRLANRASIVLGFTATPLKECFKVIGAPYTPKEGFLLGRPIHSDELINENIIIKNLYSVFYRTVIKPKDLEQMYQLIREKDYWRMACPLRVERYVNALFKELENFYQNRYQNTPFKILVLAPNTKEADLWVKYLKNTLPKYKLPDDFPIFVAHSKLSHIYGDPYRQIEMFVKSDKGFLIAVDMVKLGFDDPDLDVLVIARPIKSPVVYVQARGRVIRSPRRQKSLKREIGALLLHLAFEGSNPYLELENKDIIKKIESGGFSKESITTLEEDIFGYEKKNIEELHADVELIRIGKDEKWNQMQTILINYLRKFNVKEPDKIAELLIREAKLKNINPANINIEEEIKNFDELLDYWQTNILGIKWKLSFKILPTGKVEIKIDKGFESYVIDKIEIKKLMNQKKESLINHLLNNLFKSQDNDTVRKQILHILSDVSNEYLNLELERLVDSIYNKALQLKEIPIVTFIHAGVTFVTSFKFEKGRKYIIVKANNREIVIVKIRVNKRKTIDILSKELEKQLAKKFGKKLKKEDRKYVKNKIIVETYKRL